MEMHFLRSKKLQDRLYLFVTALDQSVIARPNFKITHDCWDQLPSYNSNVNLQLKYLKETPVFIHIQKLLEESKYSFLCDRKITYNHILESLANIQLPLIYWEELRWLKKFGYYYHHCLAITILLAKFGNDAGLSDSYVRQLLRTAIIHDIGITRLPYNILFSHDLFQTEDKRMMLQHQMISYLLIGYYSNGKNKFEGQVALHHHTPKKLEKENHFRRIKRIQEVTYLIHNMDIFDALISNRPFRPAYQIKNAILYLKQINHSYHLNLNIISWLEQEFMLRKLTMFDQNFVRIQPRIQHNQLN